MFKFLFGSSVVIPTLKLSGIIGQGGMLRAGLTLDSLNKLIDKLFSTKHPYYCPHGRPIIINLSIDELDKRFERH